MKKNNFNYLIVLFKNREKRKIIKGFIGLDRAKNFYDNHMKKNESILFEKKYQNGFDCSMELALVKINGEDYVDPVYIKDDLGRRIKIETENSDFKIIKISKYKSEEYIYDYQLKKKSTLNEIIKLYLGTDGLKMLSKLNNKVLIQNDDNYSILTFKNSDDSERFLEVISKYLYEEGRQDCIVIYDTSIMQRKYLYEILVSKGFSKSYLFRQKTTHPTKK